MSPRFQLVYSAMDEAQEILFSSLKSSGVSLPVGFSSIKDLSPDVLVCICTQSLRLILDQAPSPSPCLLPAETAERFKVCADITSTIKSLGYREDLGFHQFLYPSDEESYKLLRFLVERLSEEFSRKKELSRRDSDLELARTESIKKKGYFLEETSHELSDREESIFDERNFSLRPDILWKLRDEIKDLKKLERMLMEDKQAKMLDLQKFRDEHEILKMAVELTDDNRQYVELYIKDLHEKVHYTQQTVMELETERNNAEQTLKEKRWNIQQSFNSEGPEVQDKCIKLKEMEQEIEALMSEISEREAEHMDLLRELEKQPKLPSRKSYIKRITEITKNRSKLDADIQRILKETRELQLESNSIQERLHRTHAVVDETIFRAIELEGLGVFGALFSIIAQRKGYLLVESASSLSISLLLFGVLTGGEEEEKRRQGKWSRGGMAIPFSELITMLLFCHFPSASRFQCL